MQKWKELLAKFKSPISRFENYLKKRGLVHADDSAKFREEARNAVRDALKFANDQKKPPIDELFNGVYDNYTPNIIEQREELK
jgi:TPP-dependent pyruvate/acetoin dehydrogenase alpha subunit